MQSRDTISTSGLRAGPASTPREEKRLGANVLQSRDTISTSGLRVGPASTPREERCLGLKALRERVAVMSHASRTAASRFVLLHGDQGHLHELHRGLLVT